MERGIHYKVSLFDLEIYFHATWLLLFDILW
jgi:hypothetical protein